MGVRLYVGPYYRLKGERVEVARWDHKCPRCKYQKPQADKFCGHCGAETPGVHGEYWIRYTDVPGLWRRGSICIPSERVIETESVGNGHLMCVRAVPECTEEMEEATEAFAAKFPAPEKDAKVLWGAIAWDNGEDE